jgi:competence protein ComEA
VSDGEQLVIGARPQPTAGSAASSGSSGGGAAGGGASGAPASGAGLVDLNSADETALEALDGIGPVLAARIVEWRRSNGRFGAVEDLRQVSGIGPKTFESLKDQVRV